MCVIERHNILHPNGFREPKTFLHYCEHGTPVNPCNNAVERITEDRFLPLPEAPFAPEPLFREIQPLHREERKPRKFKDGVKLVFNIPIPFTSRKTSREQRRSRDSGSVERRRSIRHHDSPPGVYIHSPTILPPLQSPQLREPGVVQVPQGPYPEMSPQHGAPRMQTIRPRREHPLNVEIHQQTSSSSPSPDAPVREHVRQHSRTESQIREYENQKRLIRERERREHAERIARDAEHARLRAEREAEIAYNDQARLDRERGKRERAERITREAEIARLRAERDAEIVRREAREEQQRIRYVERRRIESEDRARRRQEQEEFEREQARLRQEQEDRERLQADAIWEGRRRAWEDQERRRRLRDLNIPRGPRHATSVNQRPHVSFADRGDRVINNAIRAEHERQWQRAPSPDQGWSRRRDVGGGVQRRDTIAVGQRRVYNDDRRRGGGRFV